MVTERDFVAYATARSLHLLLSPPLLHLLLSPSVLARNAKSTRMHKKIHPARVWCTYARHVAPPSRVLRLLCPRRDSRGDRRRDSSYHSLDHLRDFFSGVFLEPKTLRQCRSGQPPWGVPGGLFRTGTTNLGFVPFFVRVRAVHAYFVQSPPCGVRTML